MGLKIITAEDVTRLLPMDRCIKAMEQAHSQVTRGAVELPQRLFTSLYDKSGFLGVMPGSAADPSVFGTKIISLLPGNPSQDRPAIQGFVTLFDHSTGAPFTVIEGASITAIRTAAASGMATKALARKNATTHGVFGTGVQAGVHIAAIKAARPTITTVLIWGRSPEKAHNLASDYNGTDGLTVRPVTNRQEAAACDIVSMVTAAREPVLHGAWLSEGTHVNLVGAHSPGDRECDTDTITRSRVYVDLMQSALNEAGDILIPIDEGAFSANRIIGEIGEVLTGAKPGRSDEQDITVYKSCGIVAQDLYAAWAVYQAAVEAGAGYDVPF